MIINLSTLHLGDNYKGISDQEEYLLTIGICCIFAFFYDIFNLCLNINKLVF